jgi:hypothetical protein
MQLPFQHNPKAYSSVSFIVLVGLLLAGVLYCDGVPGDHTELKWFLGVIAAVTIQRPVTWGFSDPAKPDTNAIRPSQPAGPLPPAA